MAKLIRLSDRDSDTLDKIRKLAPASAPAQPRSYENMVVVKPWGYEFLVYQNDQVAVWFLHLEKGHATSMHCHPKKKTALIVLSGQALCNTFYNRNYLYGIDGVVIEPGVFHSTQAISSGGASLIEVETPVDKTDLVRLDDQYGRSGKGYEGLSEMKTEKLDRYGFFSMIDPGIGKKCSYQSGVFEVSLEHYNENTNFDDVLPRKRGEFYCVGRGSVLGDDEKVVLAVGDVVEGSYLGVFEKVTIQKDTLLLCFKAM